MRRIFIAIMVAATLWSGYWVVGSRSVRSSVEEWFQSRAVAGWDASYEELRVRGFPNRIDVTVSGLRLADPKTAIMWSAPYFQILRLSYKPNHVILNFPDTQTVVGAGQSVTVSSKKLQASAVFLPGTDRNLTRANLAGDQLTLTSDLGWSAAMESLLMAIRQNAAIDLAYDLGVEMQGLALSANSTENDTSASEMLADIDRLNLDATVSFNAPWDSKAIDAPRPVIQAIDLRALQIDLGDKDISAAGALTLDLFGQADGLIKVTSNNWQDILRIADLTEWFAKATMIAVRAELIRLTETSNADESVTVPLRFASGNVFLGSVNLGQQPRLFQP